MTFTDESNQSHTTLAVIGSSHVHLFEGRSLGFTKNTTPSGNAAKWLAEAILNKLNEKPGGEKAHKEK